MLDDLKALFARSWDAFVTERDRREPEDRVADMLGAMRREMAETRAALPLFDQAASEAERELERERRSLADCERRQGLAERIGDAETAAVAAEWAVRHRERVAVLLEKYRAAVAERDLRRREAERMAKRYREADAHRAGLVAELRRRERSGLDLGGGPGGRNGTEDAAPAAEPPDVDERLRELKRRMGAE